MNEYGFWLTMFLTVWLIVFYFVIIGIAFVIDYLGALLLGVLA
jgi:hypothetical protein